MQALGFIETKGLVAAVEAADSALKSANVSLVGHKLPGAGLVTVVITGDVAAVKAAVETAAESASQVGDVAAAQVIARPHDDLASILVDEPAAKKPAEKKPAARGGRRRGGAGKNNSPSV
jgi:ethanolamine utilization protein EutM